MELQYHGGNCVRLTTKKASVVIDDNLASLKLKTVTKPQDIALRSSDAIPQHDARFTADLPGEYEISEIVIEAIAARAYEDEESKQSVVIFKLLADDIRILLVGNINPNLTDEQVESIGVIDIMFVPVGGNGVTLEPEDALKLVKKIEPRVIIPIHYADKGVTYDQPQKTLEETIKVLGIEPHEDEIIKYKPKVSEFGESPKLVVLGRS